MTTSVMRDEIYSGGWGGPFSFLRIVGGFGLIGGPGMFMIRCVTSGILTSLCMGVAGATTSAMIWGTAGLPFLVCSCAGFCIGSIGFYNYVARSSLLYLDRYPKLLQLHLDANFPHLGFEKWKLEALNSSNFGSWEMRNRLMVAWLAAAPTIESIAEAKEQQIIEEHKSARRDQKLLEQ